MNLIDKDKKQTIELIKVVGFGEWIINTNDE